MSDDAQPTVILPRVHESGEVLVIMDGPIPPGFSPDPNGDPNWERERALLPCPFLFVHSMMSDACAMCEDRGVVTRDEYRQVYRLLANLRRQGRLA